MSAWTILAIALFWLAIGLIVAQVIGGGAPPDDDDDYWW